MKRREPTLTSSGVRRRARNALEKRMHDIAEDCLIEPAQAHNAETNSNLNDSRLPQIDDHLDSIADDDNGEVTEGQYVSEPDSESESEFVKDPVSLAESLANWAVQFGVSLVALSALLTLLRLYHPELPKDARTILKTKTEYKILQKCGGLYYYRATAQYRQLQTDQWSMKVSTGDNVFAIYKDICVIHNIVQSVEGIYVVFKVFTQLEHFYNYPMSSDFLRVFIVSEPTAPFRMFLLVEFMETKTVNIISESRFEDGVTWCPHYKSDERVNKAVQKCEEPGAGWKKYDVRVLTRTADAPEPFNIFGMPSSPLRHFSVGDVPDLTHSDSAAQQHILTLLEHLKELQMQLAVSVNNLAARLWKGTPVAEMPHDVNVPLATMPEVVEFEEWLQDSRNAPAKQNMVFSKATS
ncbi:hypothetical protein E1301_Tti021589 [Triplophysa tibetana]|uniref:Uncharacterized protein n=1 Tax=Triplophysa tibetana TaxID=1572043 RepID=A0A5A9PFP9_9TELE|nr:hypothetical protein E1301_Tti021589 [Triplophysa tibetana]